LFQNFEKKSKINFEIENQPKTKTRIGN
jgi:hypothetical protein